MAEIVAILSNNAKASGTVLVDMKPMDEEFTMFFEILE